MRPLVGGLAFVLGSDVGSQLSTSDHRNRGFSPTSGRTIVRSPPCCHAILSRRPSHPHSPDRIYLPMTLDVVDISDSRRPQETLGSRASHTIPSRGDFRRLPEGDQLEEQGPAVRSGRPRAFARTAKDFPSLKWNIYVQLVKNAADRANAVRLAISQSVVRSLCS